MGTDEYLKYLQSETPGELETSYTEDVDKYIKEAKKAKTSGMSVEEEALEIFAHKKKIQAMEQELRTFVNMSHGPDAWNQVLRIQADIRKKRKEAIIAAKKKQEQIIMWTLVGIGSVCSLWVVFYVIWKAMGN